MTYRVFCLFLHHSDLCFAFLRRWQFILRCLPRSDSAIACTITAILDICLALRQEPCHTTGFGPFPRPAGRLRERRVVRTAPAQGYRISPGGCLQWLGKLTNYPNGPEAGREAGWGSEFVPLKKREVGSFICGIKFHEPHVVLKHAHF